MKYQSGKKVKLGDKVEYLFGGIPFSAQVVAIIENREAIEEYKWVLEEEHTGIGLAFTNKQAVMSILCPSNPSSVRPFLIIDANDEDVLFISRFNINDRIT